MRIVNTKEIENCIYNLAIKACTHITPQCKNALKNIKAENDLQQFAVDCLLKNSEIAESEVLPVCQDTGVACVLIELGQEVYLEGDILSDAVNNGVKRAYSDGCFRKSVLDPLTRINTQDNTPAVIHTEIVGGDKVNITFLPKGFGSENMSKIYMLTPSQGREGIVNAVVSCVKEAGAKPCPPILVGVGIGGTFEQCAFLAKKALTLPIGEISNRKDVALLQTEILEKINDLDIGVQGLKGKCTALGVNILTSPTHIAGLPVAVNIQCNCVRCEKAVL